MSDINRWIGLITKGITGKSAAGNRITGVISDKIVMKCIF